MPRHNNVDLKTKIYYFVIHRREDWGREISSNRPRECAAAKYRRLFYFYRKRDDIYNNCAILKYDARVRAAEREKKESHVCIYANPLVEGASEIVIHAQNAKICPFPSVIFRSKRLYLLLSTLIGLHHSTLSTTNIIFQKNYSIDDSFLEIVSHPRAHTFCTLISFK